MPLAQVNLIVRSCSAADPIGKYGVGSLTAAMLDEGAGSRAALELADAIEFLGANLSTASSFDSSAVRMSVPVSKLAEALPLMSDVALRPTFPADELDRLRKERLTGLLQARDNVGALVQLAFPRIVFGPTHRYGTSANGLPATIEALTVDDLRSFYRAHFRPENATLLVVGDLTPATALPMLEKAFGGWKAEGMAPLIAAVPNAPQLAKRQVYLVDKPEAVTVADSHWLGRRGPLDPGLRGARGVEHRTRRIVHVAPEPEPAREERLCLRRQFRVRHAPVSGPFLAAAAYKPTRPPRPSPSSSTS